MKLIKNTTRYAALQGEFWMSFCVIFSFASVYLLKKGFTSSEVGVLIAVAGTLSAILQPIVGDVVDRSKRISLHMAILFFSFFIIVAAVLLYCFDLQFWLTALLYGVMVAVLQVVTPLVNAIGMYYINRGVAINFGIARGIGSLSYALISLAVGNLVERYQEPVIPLLVIIIYLCIIVSTVTFRFKLAPKFADVKDIEAEIEEEIKEDSLPQRDIPYVNDSGHEMSESSFFKKYPKFMTLLVGLTLLFVSHNMLNNFIFQIVQYHGAGSVEMGNVAGLAAALELPTMFLFTYYLKIVSAGNLLKVSGVFFTLKALMTYLATGMGMIYAAQFMQMFGFALFVVASVYYVNEKIAEQDKVKGQSYMTMTNTAGSVGGSLIAGWLIDSLGVPTMLLVSVLAGLLGAVLVIISAQGSRGKKIYTE